MSVKISRSGLGVDQTWQDVTGSRAGATTYTNSSGKPIEVMIQTGTGSGTTPTVNGLALGTVAISSSGVFIVPPNGTYSISAMPSKWWELR